MLSTPKYHGTMLVLEAHSKNNFEAKLKDQPNYDCPRSFGEWVIGKLKSAGYQALFAGGCVRDQLLGRFPKDFDVATSALPEEVREVFGKRRTIPVGAAFGVITVIGNSDIGHVEVATFRSDGQYTDGRRPDQVIFTDAKNDALRRDFTINGLFYDPIEGEVLDFVEGQADIERQVIRAIGRADDRFEEDKLRMLRAVRFATTLGFNLETTTKSAIKQHANSIECVSGERIAAEMQKLLHADRRSEGLRLLIECQLSELVFPELHRLPDATQVQLIDFLQHQTEVAAPVEMTLAMVLLLSLNEQVRVQADQTNFELSFPRSEVIECVKAIVDRWRLPNTIKDAVTACLLDHIYVLRATQLPWSQVQPKLIGRWSDLVIQFADLVAIWQELDRAGVRLCEQKTQLPSTELNPPPFFTGTQLQAMGIPKGPRLGEAMKELRARQLDQQVNSTEEAERFISGWITVDADSPNDSESDN